MFRKTQLFHKNLLRRIVLLLTLMVVLVSCLPKKTNTVNENYNEVEGGLVIGEMSVSQRKAAEDLTQKSEGNAEVFVENGVVHSVLTDTGETSSLNAEQTISKFFSDNAKLYLIDDFNSSFVLQDDFQYEDGSQVFSYRQVHDGVPVYLADIRVSLNEAGVVSLVNSNYLPQANLFESTTPKMDSGTAKGAFSKLGYEVLEGSEPELVIFSPHTISKIGMPFLAWHAKASGEGFYGSVLLKDSDGSLVTSSTDIQTIDHEIRSFNGLVILDTNLDAFNEYDTHDLLPESEENGRASHLHQYMNKIKAYYADNFNVKNFKKTQSKILVAVDLRLTQADGTLHDAYTIQLGDDHKNKWGIIGFSNESYERPIDTLAHEFQHVVTNDFVTLPHGKDSPESSALGEALSDFFAAVLDYEGNPWQINNGNDIVRDIENAGQGNVLIRKPAHMDDFLKPSFWNKSVGGYSYGFGHRNSTIISHALYLLTEGGVGKGKDKIPVSGIGINNSAQIVFYAISKLENNAKFYEAREAMVDSCNNLAKRGKVHVDHCNQVKNAFAAVGIGSPAKQSLVGPVPNEPVNKTFRKSPILKWQSYPDVEYFYLTYDSSLWDQTEEVYKSSVNYYLKLNQDPTCQIGSYVIADGGDINVKASKSDFYGESYFIITVSSKGKDSLETVRLEELDYTKGVEMALYLGEDPDLCRQFFWDVIELSQKDNFGLGNDKESSLEPVDMGDGFTLFVDSQLWERVKTNGHDYLASKTMSTCHIKYQFEHGMDFQRFQPEIGQKQFGNMTFETKRWYPVDNPSETILYGYYSGDIYISIEDSVASPIADECIAQVDDVLRLSVDKSFKKD